jgi:hypothetical protein
VGYGGDERDGQRHYRASLNPQRVGRNARQPGAEIHW